MARSRVALILFATAALGAAPDGKDKADYRAAVIARAEVWRPTTVEQIDVGKGPGGGHAFALGETVECAYVNKKLHGRTPKFDCRLDDGSEVKVKYGGDNGEVYAEVLATRLLWALGFGADRMYSVRVVCHGCPSTLNGADAGPATSVFDPAAVEHKMPGEDFRPDEGWSWAELDRIDEDSGGASRAQRDALRLLAVFIQHTDSKPEQQRLMCVDEPKDKDAKKAEAKTKGPMPCPHPFMLINDLGVTFGRANKYNDGPTGSVNLVEWSRTPVWRDDAACVGNLPKSATGTLDNPLIGEEGRRLLADLLARLSDAQLRDLFESARVTLRLRDPRDVFSGFPTVDEWVDAFKQKRDQIAARHCATS